MEKFYVLCEGRHKMPINSGSIFNTKIDPIDIQGIEKIAENFVYTFQNINNTPASHRRVMLNVYITGLTIACVAVIKACESFDQPLTLWHYDRESNNYYPQKVISE